MTKITTERLLIEPLHFGDANFIFKLVNTEGWLKFIGDRNVYSEAGANAYIKKIIDDPGTDYWVVRLIDNNASIGIVSFIKRDYLDCHDIGCAYLPLYFNNGYAYEATKAFLDHMLNIGGHNRVCAITNASNTNSIKLLKRLGLEFSRNIEAKNESLQVYEASVDKIIISGITKLFFSAFYNKGNARPRLDLLNDICIPDVLITNRYRSKIEVSNLTSFIDKKRKILTDGTLMEFEEKEIFEETRIAQGIAARFSRYEKKGIAYRQGFKLKGCKLFHFVCVKRSWKISSILWEDDEN